MSKKLLAQVDSEILNDLTLAVVLASRAEYRSLENHESLYRSAEFIHSYNDNRSVLALVKLSWQTTPCRTCRIETVVVNDPIRYDNQKAICEFCKSDLTNKSTA